MRKAFRVFSEPVAAVLYYVALKGIGSPIRIGLKGGGSYRLEFGDDFLVLWNCWVDEEYPLAGGETVIFDAGANLGAFALYAAHTCPAARVHALEPVAATYRKLEANLAAAPYGGRIAALKAGVAGASGVREIFAAERSPYSSFYAAPGAAGGASGSAGSAVVPGATADDGAAGAEQVKVLSLADWIAAAGVPGPIDLLKMDCEGAEMEALLGADPETLRRFRRIVFEFHEISGIPYERVAEHLSAAGFVCRSCRRDPRSRTGIARFEPA